MSYKPTHEELTAYLYGELEESKAAQIQQYLEENPEAKAELAGLEETRVVLGQWEDEEVPDMPGFMQPHTNSEWLYWRKYVAVAASILLVISFGWAVGFNLSYDDQGFRMGFNAREAGISGDEVARLLAQQEQNLLSKMNTGMLNYQDSLNYEVSLINESIDNRLNNINNLPEDQINSLLNEQKQQLVAEMNKLSEQMTADYRDIFRELVVSFSDNYETQRIQDLRSVQAAFNNLEDALSSKQEAMEEALYNLSIEVDALAQNND